MGLLANWIVTANKYYSFVFRIDCAPGLKIEQMNQTENKHLWIHRRRRMRHVNYYIIQTHEFRSRTSQLISLRTILSFLRKWLDFRMFAFNVVRFVWQTTVSRELSLSKSIEGEKTTSAMDSVNVLQTDKCYIAVWHISVKQEIKSHMTEWGHLQLETKNVIQLKHNSGQTQLQCKYYLSFPFHTAGLAMQADFCFLSIVLFFCQSWLLFF